MAQWLVHLPDKTIVQSTSGGSIFFFKDQDSFGVDQVSSKTF